MEQNSISSAPPLAFPDYTGYKVILYQPETTLIVERANETTYPNRKIVLKSYLIYSEQHNEILQHEFDILNHIRLHHETINALQQNASVPKLPEKTKARSRRGSLAMGNTLAKIHDENKAILTQTWNGQATLRTASDSIPHIIDLRQIDYCNVLVMQDVGGISLRAYLTEKMDTGSTDSVFNDGQKDLRPRTNNTLPLEDVLRISINISQALELTHRAKVVHQDITPDNILVWKNDQQVISAQLIDFSNAQKFENVETVTFRGMMNSLSYISPEQTGRLERMVDYRTDFYSLGITMWEMAVGRPPFVCNDPVQLIYSHLARQPDDPSDKNSEIPSVLSIIILKLLKKDPIDRYHSAGALTFDLMKCLDVLLQYKQNLNVPMNAVLDSSDVIEAFKNEKFDIGTEDFSSVMRFSKKLYGRDAEYAALHHLYRETALGHMKGRVACLLGPYGIGKSSLVNAVAKNALTLGMITLVAEEPLDKKIIPFAGITFVMDQLLKSLLTKPTSILQSWESNLVERLGDTRLWVLCQLVPSIQPMLRKLPNNMTSGNISETASIVVYQTIETFLSTFATKQQPIAIFIPHFQVNSFN